MKPGWTEVALGEVLEPKTRTERVIADEKYRLLGVRLECNGAFHRETKLGGEISATYLDKVEQGDFIYSRLFAWRGAFSLIGEELAGAHVSNEFPIFKPRASAKIDLRFLFHWFRQPKVWKTVEADCQGSTPTTRNRYKEEFFNALRIPLPPLAEQQRLAARLDAIESRLARVRQLREEAKAGRNVLTTSLHLAMSAGRSMHFDRLLSLREEECPVVPDGSYPQVGIRSFGLGLFKKPAVVGTATTYRTFNVLRPGMFVMSQVKGWEGAIGVCGDEFDGWFVSPEYRTFECIENECHPAYLAHLASTPWFRDQLAAATRGVGARRERIRPEMLLGMEIPFPSFKQQKDAIDLLDRVQQGSALSEASSASESALVPSLLDQIFNQ